MTLSTLGPQECPLCWHFDCQCWLEGGLGSVPVRKHPQSYHQWPYSARSIPREPSPEMIAAAKSAVSGFPYSTTIAAIWKAMWDAAQGIEAGTDETPQAAQPEGQEPGPEGMRP